MNLEAIDNLNRLPDIHRQHQMSRQSVSRTARNNAQSRIRMNDGTRHFIHRSIAAYSHDHINPCILGVRSQLTCMFYIFSNVNGKGLQCFTSEKPEGPWKHHNMQGRIYDLSVLFDDDGKIYAIHGYGKVMCTELKPDMSGPIEGTERVIIPEGSAVGEGHHIYKIDGMYYILSADYRPMGRMSCARSKSIYGPYETCVVSANETYGYHPGHMTQQQGRINDDGYDFRITPPDVNAVGCANIHQGGMLQLPNGDWWSVTMQDFHSIGRTVCLSPITWKDGWPMYGLSGNPGRSPRTWFKPATGANVEPHAAYERNDDFSGKQLKRVWQWNHNPDDSKWKLQKGVLRIYSTPAKQLMWARNTLTQRVIGPQSTTTVELNVSKLKDGDVAGLGNINNPCSWIGIVKQGKKDILRWFDQHHNDTIDTDIQLKGGKVWLRFVGDFDNDCGYYAYSTDGINFQTPGKQIMLGYQLVTFQGSRMSLFAFNSKGNNGGYAEFDNFTVDEPMADRSNNIPYGKTFRIINLASNLPMNATRRMSSAKTMRERRLSSSKPIQTRKRQLSFATTSRASRGTRNANTPTLPYSIAPMRKVVRSRKCY